MYYCLAIISRLVLLSALFLLPLACGGTPERQQPGQSRMTAVSCIDKGEEIVDIDRDTGKPVKKEDDYLLRKKIDSEKMSDQELAELLAAEKKIARETKEQVEEENKKKKEQRNQFEDFVKESIEQGERFLEKGKDLISRGEWKEGIKALSESARFFAANPEAFKYAAELVKQGDALGAEGKKKEAALRYEAAIALTPDDCERTKKKLFELMAENVDPEDITALEGKPVKLDYDSDELEKETPKVRKGAELYRNALDFYEKGHYEAALLNFHKALEKLGKTQVTETAVKMKGNAEIYIERCKRISAGTEEPPEKKE